MWEKSMPIHEVREIRGKVHIFLGSGAICKIFDICEELKHRGIHKVLIITTKNSYRISGAWAYVQTALQHCDIKYVLYDKVSPNPTSHEVDEAVQVGKTIDSQAVIAIGGGSSIDAAKSAAIMLKHSQYSTAELYEYKFTPTVSMPLIVINTTHGTGSEANRLAIISIKEKSFKSAIFNNLCYPIYSIDDPKLMTSLNPAQTKYTCIETLSNVIESCTSSITNPYSVLHAKEAIRLIDKYLSKALKNPEDLEARYYLCYASLLGGICIDNGMPHLIEALEYPLSALHPNLPHGLGASVIMPSIMRHIYPSKAIVLSDVLSPIVHGLKGTIDEAERSAQGIQKWLHSFGVTDTLSSLSFKDLQIGDLTELALQIPSYGLMHDCSPITSSKELISEIYKESF